MTDQLAYVVSAVVSQWHWYAWRRVIGLCRATTVLHAVAGGGSDAGAQWPVLVEPSVNPITGGLSGVR